jgi:hypothetical protein
LEKGLLAPDPVVVFVPIEVPVELDCDFVPDRVAVVLTLVGVGGAPGVA